MLDRDWEILLNSETFRNYLDIEVKKEAKAKQNEPILAEQIDAFEAFEQKVRDNVQLKFAFSTLKHKFLTDPEYTDKCDPLFVQAVLSLNIEE